MVRARAEGRQGRKPKPGSDGGETDNGGRILHLHRVMIQLHPSNLFENMKMYDRKTFSFSLVSLILQEFNEFRAKCGLLWSYDWISIPLVYTQVNYISFDQLY